MSDMEYHSGYATEIAHSVAGLKGKVAAAGEMIGRPLSVDGDFVDEEDFVYVAETDQLWHIIYKVSGDHDLSLVMPRINKFPEFEMIGRKSHVVYFALVFYNGGCGFSEAFEDALLKAVKDNPEAFASESEIIAHDTRQIKHTERLDTSNDRSQATHLHRATGRLYRLLDDNVQLEAANERAVLYQCMDSGKKWVRAYSEWIDGRFGAITPVA